MAFWHGGRRCTHTVTVTMIHSFLVKSYMGFVDNSNNIEYDQLAESRAVCEPLDLFELLICSSNETS